VASPNRWRDGPAGAPLRRATVRGLFAVQRMQIPVPTRARRLARLVLPVLGRPGTDDAQVESWDRPLIGRGDSREAPAPGRSVLADVPVSAVTSFEARRPPQRVEPVRCLLATGSLDVGGMDEVVAFLARRLPLAGVDVAVLVAAPEGAAVSPAGRLAAALRREGTTVIESRAEEVTRCLRDLRPDVVSAHGAARWVLDAAAALSVPYVDTLHGMHDLLDVQRQQEQQRARGVAAIVAVSALVKQQYLALNPSYPEACIEVIPNTVDERLHRTVDRVRARHALGLDAEFLWVCLARHCIQKNTYGLVSAFADVAEQTPGAHLVIAGRPDEPAYFAQVHHLVRSRGLASRVHLRDHLAEPAALLAAADAFVLDSFFEGWSLASMEALFAGVPVVSSDVGGAREQIGAGGHRGIVVANPLGSDRPLDWIAMRDMRFAPQPNRRQLVSAMLRVQQDRARHLAAREQLAEESNRRFDSTEGVERHARLLQAVVHSTAAARRDVVLR
jgi:glycosyltransferase involved in cell wall biosynthesis